MAMRTATSFLAVAFLSMAPGARAQMAVEYYHLDAVGTVLAVTNEAGALVEEHDYDVFGQEVGAQAGTQPKRFAGKERDGETGWDYFGARYYGSKVGRFTTTDPVYTWRENLADPQRWNRYAYARNNPLKFVDPDGREVELSGSDSFKMAYQTAKASLSSHSAALIREIESKEVGKVVVRETTTFDVDTNVTTVISSSPMVEWNPRAGLITTEGGGQSPALQLLHELAHALRALKDPAGFHRDVQKDPSNLFDSPEEERVIRTIEAPAAGRRGEAERHDHKGQLVPVGDVTEVPKSKEGPK